MRFKKVYIEIQNTCNLNCSFCIKNTRPSKRMTYEEFSHIIHEIKPYTNYVYLHVMGEPLLHPCLKDFIKLCEQEGIYVNITTNGTLLKDCIDELKNTNIRQMNISLHSYQDHQQENYLNDIIKSVQLLPNSYISYRLWSMNQGDLNEEDEFLLGQLTEAYQVEYRLQDVVPGSSIKLKDHVFINFEEVFEWPSLQQAKISNFGTCQGWTNMCAILSDGTVVPCCLDSKGDINLGNIFNESFVSILNTSKSSLIFNQMKQHHLNEELCQRCTYRLRFDKR